MDDARVAVVSVNYRTADLALACAASLAAERALLPNLRLVLVDGGSGDGSAERIAEGLAASTFTGWAKALALLMNGGFGWANNQAILPLLQAEDGPEFIYLLNPDARIEPGAVAKLVEVMRARPDCGAVGSQILNPDDSLAPSHFLFPSPRRELARGASTGPVDRLLGTSGGGVPMAETLVDIDWATGACVLIRADALRQAGVFDDGFFLYFEEVELMWRMRECGWTILHEPASRVVHEGGASTGVTNEALRPLPGFWYAAQRRFLTLTQGRDAAWSAFVLWLAGHALWRTRRLLGMTKLAGRPKAGRGRLRFGWPAKRDGVRGDTDWRQAAGRPPLWMRLDEDLPQRG